MIKEILLLRSKFYLPFIPAAGIKKAKIPLYKIVALNVGTGANNQILINRLTDQKKMFVSYFQIEKIFQNLETIEVPYARLGFSCQKYDNYVLINRNDPLILAN